MGTHLIGMKWTIAFSQTQAYDSMSAEQKAAFKKESMLMLVEMTAPRFVQRFGVPTTQSA